MREKERKKDSKKQKRENLCVLVLKDKLGIFPHEMTEGNFVVVVFHTHLLTKKALH